jgi:tellurite resistance protein TehA-like permease
MHKMFGCSMAWHTHVLCGRVDFMSQFGIVCSGGLLLRLHALVNVKNHVFMLACSAQVMRYIALLCLVILKPFKYDCSHVDSRWGHVSLSLRWHSV